VVFNGCDSKWSGPVGDSGLAPASRNERFHGAWVFTARVKSSKVAFGNSGDWVLLKAPGGVAIESLAWGDASEGPKDCPLIERVPDDPRGSVQRTGVPGDFAAHGETWGVPFSPGVFESPKRVEDKPSR
jgi:hypothetical protein